MRRVCALNASVVFRFCQWVIGGGVERGGK